MPPYHLETPEGQSAGKKKKRAEATKGAGMVGRATGSGAPHP